MIRRMIARAAVALALTLAMVAAALTFAVSPAAALVTGHFISDNSGRCLDVVNGGTANGTRLQQWTCNGGPQQSFTLYPLAASGTYNVKDNHSGKCVDLPGANTNSGTPLQIWDCNGLPNQTWGVLPNGQPFIVGWAPGAARHIYVVWDVTGRSTLNGARIQIWSETNEPNQLWSYP